MSKAWSYTLLSIIALFLASCATEEGNPWGEAKIELWTQFQSNSKGRFNEQGHLKTSSNYAVQIHSLSLRMNSITLGISDSGEALSFDPADPPAGYSLCHNGHCHAADGSLVDYEDIEASLATSESGAQVSQAIDQNVVLQSEMTQVSLGECSNKCQFGRGEVRSVSVASSGIYLSIDIFDTSSTRPEWPQGGKSLAIELPLEYQPSKALFHKIDRDHASGLEVRLELKASEKIFDGIDWSDELLLGSSGEQSLSKEAQDHLASLILSNLEASEMLVSVTRFNL